MRGLLILSVTLACLGSLFPATALVCELPDDGQGTVDLPPNCPGGYRGVMSIVDGLPSGTTIEIEANLVDFYNVGRAPGGSLGGEVQTWNASLLMQMTGTGGLAGYQRYVSIAVQGETHSAPRTPGLPVQSFDTVLFYQFGQVTGDPDFDLLRVTAGAGFGLPSPGHTTLTRAISGDWSVDSFFDITYRIDFIGAPGGPMAGRSGSTTGANRFVEGEPSPPPLNCELPDNGQGTIDLPPECPGGYLGHMAIVDGLPAGTTVEIQARLGDFFNVVRAPGGPLGGESQDWSASLELDMTGTGQLAGFSRFVALQVSGGTYSAPRELGQSFQSFDTALHRLQGQVTGDPDFDLLRVTAGGDFGMPSPGHTTLTLQFHGTWQVDSFFDITYRIDFIGAPGGPLAGRSGSTTGTERFQVPGTSSDIADDSPDRARPALLSGRPNPFGAATTIDYNVPNPGAQVTLEIVDLTGRVVRSLVNENQTSGLKTVEWNGRDQLGGRTASGVYFCRLRGSGFERTMQLMRLD